MHLGAMYELEVHALCADDEARRCVPPPEAPSSARAAHQRWPRLLRLRVSGVEAQQALLPDLSEVSRTLEPGQGSVRPGDLFEVLNRSPCPRPSPSPSRSRSRSPSPNPNPSLSPNPNPNQVWMKTFYAVCSLPPALCTPPLVNLVS